MEQVHCTAIRALSEVRSTGRLSYLISVWKVQTTGKIDFCLGGAVHRQKLISGLGVLTYKLNVSGKCMDNSQVCEYATYLKLIGVLQSK